jgi:hypothetical protein
MITPIEGKNNRRCVTDLTDGTDYDGTVISHSPGHNIIMEIHQ